MERPRDTRHPKIKEMCKNLGHEIIIVKPIGRICVRCNYLPDGMPELR